MKADPKASGGTPGEFLGPFEDFIASPVALDAPPLTRVKIDDEPPRIPTGRG
jgi:hypothetical protein